MPTKLPKIATVEITRDYIALIFNPYSTFMPPVLLPNRKIVPAPVYAAIKILTGKTATRARPILALLTDLRGKTLTADQLEALLPLLDHIPLWARTTDAVIDSTRRYDPLLPVLRDRVARGLPISLIDLAAIGQPDPSEPMAPIKPKVATIQPPTIMQLAFGQAQARSRVAAAQIAT